MKRWLIIVLALAIAGCIRYDGEIPEPTPNPPAGCDMSAPVEPARAGAFDGAAAYSWMENIVYDGDELRERAPADAGHDCTVAWLEGTLGAPGWDVGLQHFTGADYQAQEAAAGQGWADSCDAEDRAQVPGFNLTNLYATRGQGKTLLIAAHWDAKEDADDGGRVPAANDGASGMGIILELQRALANTNLDYRVAVAFFDAEDGFADCHPLAGSIMFANHPPITVDRMILLDMVGDENARFPRESNSESSDLAMVDLIWRLAGERDMEQFTDAQKAVTDDHLPFIEVGVPAVDIIDFARPAGEGRSGFPPYWHTTQDTPEKLSADFMGEMGLLLLDVLQSDEMAAWAQA